MRLNRFSWLAAAVLLGGLAEGGAAPPVTGRVEAITLYRGQALVTRRVPVEAGEGRVELVVGELPQYVVPDSLFAESGPGLDVRAVRLRARAVGQEPREEIRKLDDQIQAVQDKIARNKKMEEVVAQRNALLDKLEGFAAPTAQSDLARGVLNFDALKQTALFSFEQRQAAADEALKLAVEARDLGKQLSLLQRERDSLAAGSSRTVREAVVFLEKRGAAPTELKLSYLVSQAGWSPAYSFRAGKDAKQVNVEYNAMIHQMSGENWSGVALTLSTASPGLSAQGPGLAPFRVALSKAAGKGKPSQQEAARQFQSSQVLLQQAEQGQRAAQDVRGNRDFNWKMNTAANDAQELELTLETDALKSITAEPGVSSEVASVAYRIENPVSLESRSDQQMLRIADMALASRFYYMATPILTSYVYREAELTNNALDALLAGPVSVYLDGRFVGRGEIPTVAKGETVVMGFGADPQIRARRELVSKTEAVQGGNREVTLQYRLVLENFKAEPVSVRLLDRYPLSERESDVRVTLFTDKMSDKLTEDKLYLRLEAPKSILRWDIDVPANASGEKARTVEYGYRMEFQRDMQLGTPQAAGAAPAAELRDEFERMQSKRSLK